MTLKIAKNSIDIGIITRNPAAMLEDPDGNWLELLQNS